MALCTAPAFAAETLGRDMVAPKQFTDNHATQGEAIIANTPAGPLGLRFSGGFVVDSEQPSGQFAGTDLEDAAPTLGLESQVKWASWTYQPIWAGLNAMLATSLTPAPRRC